METALGQVDMALLESVAKRTGGHVLGPDDLLLPTLETVVVGEVVDLIPWIVEALLLLFMVDVVIRRWENVHGVFERLGFRT